MLLNTFSNCPQNCLFLHLHVFVISNKWRIVLLLTLSQPRQYKPNFSYVINIIYIWNLGPILDYFFNDEILLSLIEWAIKIPLYLVPMCQVFT